MTLTSFARSVAAFAAGDVHREHLQPYATRHANCG